MGILGVIVMAIVNISLDTVTRQTVLTINGILMPASSYYMDKYTYDGHESVSFSYTVEDMTDDSGMRETRRFYLPSPEELATEAHADLDDNGFASKEVHDDTQTARDLVEHMRKNRNI